jgi:hypothetical protein
VVSGEGVQELLEEENIFKLKKEGFLEQAEIFA